MGYPRGEGSRVPPDAHEVLMINYSCPGCQQLLRIDPAAAARPCRCPRCGHVSVPAPVATLAGSASSPTPPQSLTQTGAPPPAAASQATTSNPVPVRKEPVQAPVVPGYDIIEELGRGAMGVVYKARQVGLNRLVALKVVRSGAHASEQQRSRFQIEAAALARLRHPHIVQIHEVGEHQGLPYFAMEFLPGGTLARQLRGQPLPPEEAARMVATLARAVQHAHEAGVVHRDLKPTNVLLGADGTARIADFGLAKHLDAAQGPTCTGTVLGTPSYMAPEQAAGRTHDIGPAADVYSLGAVLYELVTGRPPFKAANPTETIVQVLSEEPVPPSFLQARLPQPLEIICLKCLAKDPARRYASAGALADDLERFLSGEPIQAKPVSMPMRALLWARRRPAPAALLVLGVLMVLGVLIGLVWFARHEQQRRQEVVALGDKAEDARQEAARALADAQRLTNQEIEARGLAETQLQAATRARRESLRKFAELCLERGRDLCESQPADIRLGMVWMARGGAYAAEEPDLRRICGLNIAGWLRRFTPSMRLCLEHDHVNVAAFSPDGKRIATGRKAYEDENDQRKGSLAIHDAPSGRRLVFVELNQLASAVAWSKDGRHVAVGTGTGTRENWNKGGPGAVRVVDSVRGEQIGPVLAHPRTVRSVAFHPDGKRLLTGSQDSKARLWNLPEGKLVKELKLGAPVVAVGFTPDGKHFITVANGTGPNGKPAGQVQTWDATLDEPQQERSFFTSNEAHAAELTPDSRAVLVGDYTLGVWNTDLTSAAFGKPIGKLVGNGRWGVALSSDGSLMATCGNDWQARVFQTANGQQIGQTLLMHGWAYCVAFSPDGKTLLTGDNDGAALWDVTLPQPPQAELQAERVHTLAFSPDHTRVAASLDRNQVQLFDVRTGQALGPPLQHPTGTPRLALGPDNKTLVTACFDRQVRVWDAVAGQLIFPKPWSHGSEVDVVALSADGKLAVSGCRDGKAQVWDMVTGKAVGPNLVCGADVTAAAFSPDSQHVVLGDLGFQVRRWQVGEDQPRGRPVRLTGRPTVLAVSGDGRRVLVGTTGDNVARLVDVETGQPVGPLLLHKDAVLAVAFSPDEKMMATGSASRDGTARLWDTATGKALGPPIRHRGHVPAVAFSRDGTVLWTTGTDRQVVRTELPAPPAGSPEQVYFETVLRAGMFLDQQNVEHALGRLAWLQVQKRRNELDGPKKP